MLTSWQTETLLILSSVALAGLGPAIELEPGVIYSHDADKPSPAFRLVRWRSGPLVAATDMRVQPEIPRLPPVPSQVSDGAPDELSQAVVAFQGATPSFTGRRISMPAAALTEAVRIRLQTVPSTTPSRARVAVLFSGGLDSAVLAALIGSLIPPDEPVDLLNVAFYSPRVVAARTSNEDPYDVPDRLTARKTLEDLRIAQVLPLPGSLSCRNMTKEHSQRHAGDCVRSTCHSRPLKRLSPSSSTCSTLTRARWTS